MTRRQRLAALIALTLAGSGGFAAATAAGSHHPVPVPVPVERVHRYYGAGPWADYNGDAGGLGQIDPLAWRTPKGTSGSAVVEASFQYRTRGAGPFEVSVGVKPAGGKWLTVRPGELALAPAPQGTATTVRFLVPHLAGGHRYGAQVFVNSVFPAGSGTNKITTSRMLLTVDSTTG